MINPRDFIDLLIEVGIEYFIGVPDSLMSSISKCLHFDFKTKIISYLQMKGVLWLLEWDTI